MSWRRDVAAVAGFGCLVFQLLGVSVCLAADVAPGIRISNFRDGQFHWQATGPLIPAPISPDDVFYSVKDPSVVFHHGRWHVFATVRGQKRSHQTEYISFRDWQDAGQGARHFLKITNGYYCAPQVFYFTPHQKWYLIYQARDTNRPVALQPAFSTVDKIEDWSSWTPPRFLYERHPRNIKGWIDFWVICDDTRAHLFFTSNNGLMWRADTRLGDFPHGWSEPVIVLRGDIFEASHTYKIKGQNQFLTVIEAQNGSRRYYKAYVADGLDGDWKPLAATWELSMASVTNVLPAGARWTESISHGEFIRSGIDERMEMDPENLRFVFQGVLDADLRGKKYGEIPWRIGILDPR
jgi:hypothetical protein